MTAEKTGKPTTRPPDHLCRGLTTAGGYCQQRAGWGTDHAGAGRCKLHGGAVPIKHGRYSKVARERLGDILYELSADDCDPLDLVPDLELVRACAVYALRKHGPSPVVVDQLERASRIADRIDKRRRTRSLTLEDVSRVVQQLGVAVAKHVQDPGVLAAIEAEWAELRVG